VREEFWWKGPWGRLAESAGSLGWVLVAVAAWWFGIVSWSAGPDCLPFWAALLLLSPVWIPAVVLSVLLDR